jgi:hypothetical protein
MLFGMVCPDRDNPTHSPLKKSLPSLAHFAGAPATEEQQIAAQHFACAQLELAQIQLIRAQQWEKTDPIEGLPASAKALRHLASMDRYERCALTKRRKAAENLRAEG